MVGECAMRGPRLCLGGQERLNDIMIKPRTEGKCEVQRGYSGVKRAAG